MCLAQGHNAVMPMRLKPTVPLSRVEHSNIEPLCWVGGLSRNVPLKLFSTWASSSGGVSFKDFSIFSSGDHFVWWSGTIMANLDHLC